MIPIPSNGWATDTQGDAMGLNPREQLKKSEKNTFKKFVCFHCVSSDVPLSVWVYNPINTIQAHSL